jgi:catechol 2,3-dioxygenase-like lactoylglutathione lyase family enzyme
LARRTGIEALPAQLNHTIVWCRDKEKSTSFLTGVLGLPPARDFMHFKVVELGNGVSMDYYQYEGDIARQHYAFLVSEDEFDVAFSRIAEAGITYWADPARLQTGEVNHHWGGRGVYFEDPEGHLLELITKPYGDEKEIGG